MSARVRWQAQKLRSLFRKASKAARTGWHAGCSYIARLGGAPVGASEPKMLFMRYLFVSLFACALGVGCQSVETFDDGKRWGEAARIDDRPRWAIRAQVAIDATGKAIAVWDQTDPESDPTDGSDDIWFNFREAREWGEAGLVESREPDDSLEAQIAVDGEGNSVVVFRQSEGTDNSAQQGDYRIWAVRHTPSGGWEDPKCIQSNDPECIVSTVEGDASQPQIAVNPRGDAVVVWQQGDATDESVSIWANRFRVGSGWDDAGPLETGAKLLLTPQVAIDDDGNAMVVWEGVDDDDGRSSIWSRRLTPDGAREALLPVEKDDRGDARSPQVATDAEGNAIAVWKQQTDGPHFDIWSNRYVAGAGWGDEARIDTQDAGDAEEPQVAVDRDGNAIAVWAQSGGGRAGIWSNRYVAGAGWGDARPVGQTGLGSARLPQVSTDPNGNAVAVWVQFDGEKERVWANRYYVASGGWGRSPRAIDEDDEFRATGPQVALDFDGDAVAVWQQSNDRLGFDIWSNSLEAVIPAPGSGTK